MHHTESHPPNIITSTTAAVRTASVPGVSTRLRAVRRGALGRRAEAGLLARVAGLVVPGDRTSGQSSALAQPKRHGEAM